MPKTLIRHRKAEEPEDPNVVWTEKELQATIRAAAADCGWLYYHTQVSLYSARGFPDLVLCKPPRLLLVELKGPKGQPTPAQITWLTLLSQVPHVETLLIYPEDLEIMYKILLGQANDKDMSALRANQAARPILPSA